MDSSAWKKYQPHSIVLLLFFFMVIAFVLRIIPAVVTRDQAFFPVYDTDTWYNLRQIEVMVHAFPQYNWFDPMTAYPAGKMIDWGPLFPFISALFCLVTGATTRSGIISAAGFVSPLMAALMVPVMYSLGTKIGDWKTGITASGLITITSFLYFTFSSYGMIDHHSAEVLFTTLFFLAYVSALSYAKEHPPGRKNLNATAFFCSLSALAGIFYFLALITSTTALLVLLIIAVYTFLQGIADFLADKDFTSICMLNLVFLGLATILLFLFGFRHEGLDFTRYSLGIVLVHGALAAGTLLLSALSNVFHRKHTPFLLVLAGLVLGGIILSQVVLELKAASQHAADLLFGYSTFSVGVQETLPWSFSGAFDAINVAIILVAGGFLVLGYRLSKKRERELIFVAVWSLAMLLITIQHQRFLYYFTVNIALLSAVCITEPFRWNQDRILSKVRFSLSRFTGTVQEESSIKKLPVPEKKAKKKKPGQAVTNNTLVSDGLKLGCLVTVCALTVLHIAISLPQDYHYALNARDREIPADWIESLEWLRTGTPDPGVDYFGRYESKGYISPPESYGILAVWDAGHWITFFSHRLPVTNPFQDNLEGHNGTAAFFLSENESEADSIIRNFNGRYVITDSDMAIDRFTNLVPWASGSADISHYIKWFLIPDRMDSLHLKKIHLYDGGYFQTLVVRLHNFDGSLITPASADYIHYTIRKPTSQESAEASGYSRVISDRITVNVAEVNATNTPIIKEGTELLPTTYAMVYSGNPDKPLSAVPALTHYRLVHESPKNASVTLFPESDPYVIPGIKMVKVFEFVKGARITGEGMIELPVVTNTGRTFTYRQESSGGEFVVPYSTQENPYEVRASGPYHITGTSRYIEVTEQEVTTGQTVNR